MEGYIWKLLLRYAHPAPCKPQCSPHQHREIIYGAIIQKPLEEDTSPRLYAAGIKHIQGIFGTVLYHARAVNNKLLATLSFIGSEQSKSTQATTKAANHLMNYLATYPNYVITYRSSNMVLAAHYDAAYLNETCARSRAGSHIFCLENDPIPRDNGPVLSLAQIINVVMSSASEAELSGLFITAKAMVPLRKTLKEMKLTQPRSPIQTDNSTSNGFSNQTIV